MVDALLKKVTDVLILPLVELAFAVAVVVFVWGVFQYLLAQNNPDARSTGTNHIMWGVIGMAIMVSAYGIINFVINTVKTI